MKRTLNLRNKIIMFLLAIIFPLSATGIVFSANQILSANADDSSTIFMDSYFEEVSMSNNNFNSNTSSTHSMTTISGWTGLTGQGTTTAGAIHVGESFQTYMTSTYYLSNNPGRKSQANDDYKILMINSKSNKSSDRYQASKGYRSSTLNLEANSFYQFSVAFKTDTNYKTTTEYVTSDGHTITETDNCYISKNSFENAKWGDYVAFTYTSANNNSSTKYVIKSLEDIASFTLTNDLENIQFFYEDDEYVGFMYEETTDVFTPVYTLKTNTQPMDSEDTNAGNRITSGAELKKCKTFNFNQKDNRFDIIKDTPYYTEKNVYEPINDYVYGSVYLNGLKDKDGKTVKADFEKINSREWVNFYFYIATGNEKQTVNLDLWLGANSHDRTSTGAVFFDDCHVYRYSENKFWSIYKEKLGLSYTQKINYTDDLGNITGTEEIKQSCEQLIDLRQEENLAFNGNNFDFETSGTDVDRINNWEVKTNTGHAQVFNTNTPEIFVDGYQSVGSDFSCNVDFNYDTNGNMNGLTIKPNKYALSLWAKDGMASVKSESVSIGANEIYKVTASYKISDISSGSAYMSIKENDKVLKDYNLELYTLTNKDSSALTSKGNDNFNNKYATAEFYVKGGALYDTNFNIVLSLGKDGEKATGCITFDNIKIERSTTEAFNNASNSIEFNANSASTAVPNGNFNKLTVTDQDKIYDPQNWTIEGNENKLNFHGVINTKPDKYKQYVDKFNEYKTNGVKDEENPYAWTINANNSPISENAPNNVMMFANYGATKQILKSDNITMGTSSAQHLTFKYKTPATIIVKLFKEDGVLLLESPKLSSYDWTEYDIYFNPGSTDFNYYIQIEFVTTENKNSFTYAYFDDFEFQTYSGTLDLETEDKVNTKSAIIDLSNSFLNLPTNNITDDLQTSTNVAFTGKTGSSDDGLYEGGIIKADSTNYSFTDKNSSLYISDKDVKYVMYMSVQNPGSYTMTSNYKVSLEADKYAKLSFKLRTNFAYQIDSTNALNKDKTYNFGVTAGLTGFDYATNLNTESKNGYQEYTIYFHNTSSDKVTENVYFALICDSIETTGVAVIYDFNFQTLEDDSEYKIAQDTASQKDYDLNKADKKVFVSKLINQEEETPNPDEDNNTENNNNSAGSNWWILAPSIITGLAIIIAVVGYVLRKVKIKKIERKRKETYDRKESLNIDVIKKKALEERNAELISVEETRNKFQKELDKMEQEHKEKVVNLRNQDKNQISKDTDKEFKQFARKRTVISERIDALNKQIEEIKSPEYLLNVERKVYTKEEMKQKELAKMSKKLSKEQEKLSKGQTTDKDADNKK